jgi:hypothetical protein
MMIRWRSWDERNSPAADTCAPPVKAFGIRWRETAHEVKADGVGVRTLPPPTHQPVLSTTSPTPAVHGFMSGVHVVMSGAHVSLKAVQAFMFRGRCTTQRHAA